MSENSSKKSKLEEKDSSKETIDSKSNINETIHSKSKISLDMFELSRVLDSNPKTKWIAIEANHSEQKAVIILEKLAFNESNVKQILEDQSSGGLRQDFHNDIYGNYFAFPKSELNGIKTTVIHPATDKHIQKYLKQEIRVVLETPDIYREITLPHIQSQQFSLQWVQNILDHKSESERLICDIEDPEIGFVLLPDMKWDGIQMESFYLMAICRKPGIKSLRDLNETHLPLLNNIKTKSLEAIEAKYGLTSSQLRTYIHYQPSYYHFHVHFTLLSYEDSGSNVERAHLLDTVINNINLNNDYYQKSNLLFPVRENDSLFKAFVDKNLI